jgi:hypothetical protein
VSRRDAGRPIINATSARAMSSRNTRRLLFVVVVLGLLALFRVWIDKPSRDEATSRGSSTNVGEQASAANPTRADPTVAGRAAISRDATRTAETARELADDRMRLQVHAPSDVKEGDVFEAQIDFEANGGVREIMFLVNYDQSRLRLVGSSEGNFAQRAGLPAEFGAEEPSDGYIQVRLTISNGLSAVGAGTLAIFQFEAIKAGTSGITLQNLAVTDTTGDTDPNSAVVNDASVTIH